MKLEDQLCFLSRATKDIAFDAQQEMAKLDEIVLTAKQAADVASKMRLLVKAVKAAVDSFEEHRYPHILDTYLEQCMLELSSIYNAVMADQPEMHIVDLGDD